MNRAREIDDFLGSDDDDLTSTNSFNREWLKADNAMKNDGYRTGLEKGQEECLQKGFDSAFKEALKMSLAAGKLQGAISAQLSYHPTRCTAPSTGCTSQEPGTTVSALTLQDILSSTSDLMSSIPSLIKADQFKTYSSSHTVDTKTQSDQAPANKTVVEGNASCALVSHMEGNGKESTGTERKDISCEALCSNKSHFWSQLENFKQQAQLAGLTAFND
ncbi:uncharacterized protein LOC131952718 [Physella acuta]|uniref:uncharacterized protein LOC131952718 n=1 Tax=Physella acuta TaxID=109671 RepID=UPI0027DADA39|nr:uncharacterized protein LOC131952718 [Physella acuta]